MKTIIEMAREAGIRDCTCDGTRGCLEAFTALVRADERERQWVGLTDDELADLWYKESLDWMEFARAHEAKLKEKNT